jgi:hypothetical protein
MLNQINQIANFVGAKLNEVAFALVLRLFTQDAGLLDVHLLRLRRSSHRRLIIVLI